MSYPANEALDRDTTEWDPAYRSLSATAVVALIFGLVSPVVVFGSLLVAAPCVAIALGALALRRIAQSDGALTGRGFALTGLALGVFCLSAWFAQSQTSWVLTQAQAARVAQEWLDRVEQGDAEGAFLLTLTAQQRGPMAAYLSSPERRQPPEQEQGGQQERGQDEGLRENSLSGAEGEDPEIQLQKFRQGPEMTSLLGEGRISGRRLVSRGAVKPAGQAKTFVVQDYELILKDRGPLTYRFVLESRDAPPCPRAGLSPSLLAGGGRPTGRV